ncbi:nicotinamide riboside transporter PnuC [Nonomuraea africana]|uniref:Nicotinamide mononucleotide transporter n=1 Tax=Nonomuraea africana TaxID=46171 RepID=A0ABR9KHG9_9ACTN|nr:nicotinamide riboside transporter PnuC [Nonomuraea africana]MBE1561454.1 nicotinamide mononucleotide transporter [Nonomuraea africana]
MSGDFTVFGTPVYWTDLIGNIAALATVVLAMRRSVWTWPVQLTGAVLLFIASINAEITGNALKQVLFGALAVYGWYKWTKGMRDDGGLAVRPASTKERSALIGAMVVGTVAIALLFTWLNSMDLHISWAPWPDAYIFVGSAVATFAQGRALLDFWWIWVLVDLVGVPLAFTSGLVVSGVVYAIFLVLVILGFRSWLKQYRATAAVPA